MALYDLEMDNPSGMQDETQEQIFSTCVHKMESVLGAPNNVTTFGPLILRTCANLTSLAKLLYDTAKPFDLDRIAPERVAWPLYGIVSPVLILFSLFLNCGMVTILLRQRTRTAMSVLIGGIAVLDGLTGLLQLPFFVYAYMLDGHEEYPSMSWCKVYRYVSKLLPTIMHTASLWLAALLALQRHLGVCGQKRNPICIGCRNQATKVLLSVRGTFVAAVVCVFSSGVVHALQMVFLHLQQVQLLSKNVLTPRGLDLVDTCSLRLKDRSLQVAYYYVYTWLRLVLAEFVPCFLIGGFNVSLVRVMRRSRRYRRRLVHGHRQSEKQEAGRARRTTGLLLTLTSIALVTEMVVIVILLVEFVHVATRRSLIAQVRKMGAKFKMSRSSCAAA